METVSLKALRVEGKVACADY